MTTYLSYIPDRNYIIQNVKSSVPEGKSVSLPMCSKTPENLRGKINISLEERKMEDIEKDLGENMSSDSSGDFYWFCRFYPAWRKLHAQELFSGIQCGYHGCLQV